MRRFWVWLLVALTLASATAAPAQIVGGVPLPLLQGPSGCDPRATLELDYSTNLFCSNGQKAGSAAAAISGWSYSRTGTEYASTSSGLLVPFASGVPGITDLGLGVWEARTNLLINNTLAGAVAGSPGTLPTGWSATLATGISQQIVGTGTQNGVQYIDIRLSGTPSASTTSLISFTSSRVTISASTAYVFSSYAAIAAGSLTNISSVKLQLDDFTSGSAYAGTPISQAMSLTSSLARFSGSASTDGTGATANAYALVTHGTGSAIDITLRIGFPQFELGSFPGPVVATSGSSATRGAASASVGLSALSQGTVVGVFSTPPNTSMRALMSLNDGSGSNRIDMRVNLLQPTAFVSAGGVLQANPTSTSVLTPGSRAKMAISWSSAGVNYADSGGYSVSTGAITVPSFTQLQAGNLDGNTGNAFDSTIERLIVYPTKMTLAQVQAAIQ
jgi:hypothetical protein